MWDCQHPLSTTVYDGQTFCRPAGVSQHPQQTQHVVLAQVVKRHHTEGFKCEAVRTTRSHICGAFLYEKALPSMTSTTQLQLAESNCRKLFYNGVFRDPEMGHKQRDLKSEACFTSQQASKAWSTSLEVIQRAKVCQRSSMDK